MELTNSENMNAILNCFKDDIYLQEFDYNYNIIELGCLKKIIGEYVKGSQSGVTYMIYKSKNEKNKYFTYILTEIKEDNQYLLRDLNEELKNLIKKYVCILIEIDIKKLKKIRVKVLINKKIPELDEKILKKKIASLYTKLNNDLEGIINSVKHKNAISSGVVTYAGLRKREAIGFFSSKYIEFDAGEKGKYFSVTGKKIKIKYRFNKYTIVTKFDNICHEVSFTNLYSNILSHLFQMITKTQFDNQLTMDYFGENSELSNFNKLLKFENMPDTQFESYIYIPQNLDQLIDNFFMFEPLKQNYIFRSCKCLNNAIKSYGIKSIFFSYQAIENMVAYYELIGEYHTNQRTENVKRLLMRYYNNNFPDDAHKFWDDYRNKYAHNGIEEEELIELAIEEKFNSFNPTEVDKIFYNIVQKVLINILKDI